MTDESDDLWTANIGISGKKDTVRKILKLIEAEEEGGNLTEVSRIDGPDASLRLMMKRRRENLALEVNNDDEVN
ncbi:hypothetical protein ABRP59_00075 [Pectobacterium punjabense]|uniref:hypothetical protein n=1 Tax=Pectobacterium punjabense TaxID=2108399 RepID=UPI0032EE8FF5